MSESVKIELNRDNVKKDDINSLLKKWVYNDYYTPKAKAEVVIDMLISEYVTDIIDWDSKNGEHRDFYKYSEPSVLLAKEFPIKTGNKNLRSASVDYLVKKGDTLYLVELKTDEKSFNQDQLDRMKDVCVEPDPAVSMFEHYEKVIKKTEKKNKYYGQKYNAQKKKIISYLCTSKENLKKYNVSIIYLSLSDINFDLDRYKKENEVDIGSINFSEYDFPKMTIIKTIIDDILGKNSKKNACKKA